MSLEFFKVFKRKRKFASYVSWERQSPDWRFATRQSGDWRSQSLNYLHGFDGIDPGGNPLHEF
jgi:hypothetical protein